MIEKNVLKECSHIIKFGSFFYQIMLDYTTEILYVFNHNSFKQRAI